MLKSIRNVRIKYNYSAKIFTFKARQCMLDIKLRKLNEADAECLKQYEYNNLDIEEIVNLINVWNKNNFQGRYFEMFGAEYEYSLVGIFSIVETEDGSISIGPTVFEPFRQKGIAFYVLNILLDMASKKGYKKAVAQVRPSNKASIKLHEKVGYTNKCLAINRNNNEVFIFEKKL